MRFKPVFIIYLYHGYGLGHNSVEFGLVVEIGDHRLQKRYTPRNTVRYQTCAHDNTYFNMNINIIEDSLTFQYLNLV